MTVHATTAGKEGADKARQGKARSSDVDGQEEEEEAQKLRGILYVDDAGIVSRLPGELARIISVVGTACGARR